MDATSKGLNAEADLKRVKEQLSSRTSITSDDLFHDMIKQGSDFDERENYVEVQFEIAQSKRRKAQDAKKESSLAKCEELKRKEKTPGSPEGSELRSQILLRAQVSKLESEIAENKGKLESGVAVLFAGTNAEDFETG